MLSRVLSEFFEPGFIDSDALNHCGLDSESKFFQFVSELVSVNQVDGRCSIAGCFFDGVTRKGASRNEKSFIGPPYHSASEVADMARGYNAAIPLALENDVEAHKAVDACDTLAVYTTVARPACYLYLNETGLAQKALN